MQVREARKAIYTIQQQLAMHAAGRCSRFQESAEIIMHSKFIIKPFAIDYLISCPQPILKKIYLILTLLLAKI